MRKRSKYRPKGVNPTAFNLAIAGAHKMCVDDQLNRAARVRASVDLLAQSKGGESAWRDVVDCLNMIEALAWVGLVKQAKEFVEHMQDTIAAAVERQSQTGSNVLRPVEVTALRDLAATWAEVLSEVTCAEYFAAEQRVIRKVTNALRGGNTGGARVITMTRKEQHERMAA